MDPEVIRELFAQFRPVTVKRMFGGAGVFVEGLAFAVVFDGVIYLRVDEASIADFEREGSKPFVYPLAKTPGRAGRPSRNFWRQPGSDLRVTEAGSGDDLAVWAARALAIAERKKAAPRRRADKAPAKLMAKKKPGTKKPGTKKPGTKKPGTKKPGTKKPGAGKPGAKKPASPKP